VFCTGGQVAWSNLSESFPYRYLRRGRPHPDTGAGEFVRTQDTTDELCPTPASAWFTDDSAGVQEAVLEQCVTMPSLNASLSFIVLP
jgi:hypothetical protein